MIIKYINGKIKNKDFSLVIYYIVFLKSRVEERSCYLAEKVLQKCYLNCIVISKLASKKKAPLLRTGSHTYSGWMLKNVKRYFWILK